MKRVIIALLAAAIGFSVNAGATTKLLKRRAAAGDAVTTGKWHPNLSKARSYAEQKKVPLVAVWSNGDVCGHCVRFASACNSTYFKNWQKTSGMVFFFGCSTDKANPIGGTSCEWCRKKKLVNFPFVRIYWPKGNVDVAEKGDVVDGWKSSATGGKKVAAYIKKKVSAFKYNMPYNIAFLPNGGEGEMATVSAKYNISTKLPANTFVREDYAFLGWSKTATGAVAYKNSVSVKNLTTTLNGTVKLYAKWRRVVFRDLHVGSSKTVTMSELKGWTTSSKVPGMKWNGATGKFSGKPTKVGEYKLVFKKGKSTATRWFVVE